MCFDMFSTCLPNNYRELGKISSRELRELHIGYWSRYQAVGQYIEFAIVLWKNETSPQGAVIVQATAADLAFAAVCGLETHKSKKIASPKHIMIVIKCGKKMQAVPCIVTMLKADSYNWMTPFSVWTMLKPLLLWASIPWPVSHTPLLHYILQSHCWLCCIFHSQRLGALLPGQQMALLPSYNHCHKCQLSLSASRHRCSLATFPKSSAKPWSQLTQSLWSHTFLRARSLHGIWTGWIGILACCIDVRTPCWSRWLQTQRSGYLPDTETQPS